MGISAHLSTTLTSDYVQGGLSPGAALAAETHLALCEQCRSDPRLWVRQAPLSPAVGHSHLLEGLLALEAAADGERPALSNLQAAGPWAPLAKGVDALPLRGASGLGESVHLLRVDAGAFLALPSRTHLIVVLRGVVQFPDGPHERGDLIETAAVRLALAAAGSDSATLCLLVGDGEMYPRPLIDLASRTRPRRRAGP